MTRLDSLRARLGRRQFLRQMLAAGAGAAAGVVLPEGIGGARQAWAAASSPAVPGAPPDKQGASGVTVRPDDPAITAEEVEYPGVVGPLRAYQSAPKGGEIYPGVLVLHDRQGLTEHFKDITRRLAKAGYAALAPDLLSRLGGTAKFSDPVKMQAALLLIAPFQFIQDMNSSVIYLEARPFAAKNKIGAMGFGLGSNLLWLLLSQNADIKAAIPFSGGLPGFSNPPRFTAAVLAIYGESERNSAEMAEFDALMKKTGAPWAYKAEPKAGRDFFDDSKSAYVVDAARDAWHLTMDWFTKYLGG